MQVFSSRLPFCVQAFRVPCVGFSFVQVLPATVSFFLCSGLSPPFLCRRVISFVWQACLFLCLQTSRAFCAGLSLPFLCRFPSVGSLPSLLRAGPSLNPSLCAGSPSMGTCPFLSCVQVFRPLSPPSECSIPLRGYPLSRFRVQVPLSVQFYPPLSAQDPPPTPSPGLRHPSFNHCRIQ